MSYLNKLQAVLKKCAAIKTARDLSYGDNWKSVPPEFWIDSAIAQLFRTKNTLRQKETYYLVGDKIKDVLNYMAFFLETFEARTGIKVAEDVT